MVRQRHRLRRPARGLARCRWTVSRALPVGLALVVMFGATAGAKVRTLGPFGKQSRVVEIFPGLPQQPGETFNPARVPTNVTIELGLCNDNWTACWLLSSGGTPTQVADVRPGRVTYQFADPNAPGPRHACVPKNGPHAGQIRVMVSYWYLHSVSSETIWPTATGLRACPKNLPAY